MTRGCPSFEELVAYRMGELDERGDERLEAHLFGCDRCARALEGFERLRRGAVDLVRAGAVTVGATAELVDHALASGVPIRSYTVPPGGIVPCTIAPEDAFIAIRLAAGVAGAERVDMDVVATAAASGAREERRVDDVLTDPRTGEVIVLYAGELVRSMPRSRWTMHLDVSSPTGTRRVGPFTLEHTPWGERASS